MLEDVGSGGQARWTCPGVVADRPLRAGWRGAGHRPVASLLGQLRVPESGPGRLPVLIGNGIQKVPAQSLDSAGDQQHPIADVEVSDAAPINEAPPPPHRSRQTHLTPVRHPEIACARHVVSLQGHSTVRLVRVAAPADGHHAVMTGGLGAGVAASARRQRAPPVHHRQTMMDGGEDWLHRSNESDESLSRVRSGSEPMRAPARWAELHRAQLELPWNAAAAVLSGQQFAIGCRASHMRWRLARSSCSRRIVRTDFGIAARLSNMATLSWSIPSSSLTGTHVRIERQEERQSVIPRVARCVRGHY